MVQEAAEEARVSDVVPEIVMKVALAIEHAMRDPYMPDVARAAIRAMREPPDGMCVPGGLAIEEAMFAENKLVFDGARDCFNAMIDAALSSPPDGQKR